MNHYIYGKFISVLKSNLIEADLLNKIISTKGLLWIGFSMIQKTEGPKYALELIFWFAFIP